MEKVFKFILITILILHCSCKTKVNQLVYILKNNVNIYTDENSKDILKIKNEMDTLCLESEKISNSGRIKIKDETGTTGWVDEKYTSYISIDWKKKKLPDNLYIYIPSNININFKENVYIKTGDLEELYDDVYDLEIHFYLVKNQTKESIIKAKKIMVESNINEIQIGKNKDYNNSLWILKDKVFYYKTTETGDSSIVEGISFITDNYINKKYTLWISFRLPEDENNLLLVKKIMFSILKSIR